MMSMWRLSMMPTGDVDLDLHNGCSAHRHVPVAGYHAGEKSELEAEGRSEASALRGTHLGCWVVFVSYQEQRAARPIYFTVVHMR